MKFKNLEDDYDKANGTFFQGEFNASYDQLIEVFGSPVEGDGNKIDCMWIVEFEDGTLATVYNFKNGLNYDKTHGLPVQRITEWHVGGFNNAAYANVTIALG